MIELEPLSPKEIMDIYKDILECADGNVDKARRGLETYLRGRSRMMLIQAKQPGVCPDCRGQLFYGEPRITDQQEIHPYECQTCGLHGDMPYRIKSFRGT